MVNLIGAIIISALIGFLAGHFSSPSNDAAPVSLKEAVTGEIDAPPPQFNLPRPPSNKPEKKLAPVMCEAGKSLQDQLTQLRFFELQNLCREAERNWQKRNVDAYAAFPGMGSESDQAQRDLLTALKEPLQTATYWRGETVLGDRDRRVHMEVFANFYRQKDPPDQQRHGGPLSVGDPAELCYGISPFFVVNGKGLPAASAGACGANLRKRGDAFLFSWEMFGDPEINPVVGAMLIPLPGGSPSGLEYLSGETEQWVQRPDFRWKPSSFAEFEQARERHLKKVEDGPR